MIAKWVWVIVLYRFKTNLRKKLIALNLIVTARQTQDIKVLFWRKRECIIIQRA
jgi:hypothetical protein